MGPPGKRGERPIGCDDFIKQNERLILRLAGGNECGGTRRKQPRGFGAGGIGIGSGKFFEHHARLVVAAGLEKIATQHQ